MLACEENAKRLHQIFQKVVPNDHASWTERYKKAAHAVMPVKKRKVEDLMKEIPEKLQLFHTSRFFKSESEQKNEKKSKELETAISQLSDLLSSLPRTKADTITIGPARSSFIQVLGRRTTTIKVVAPTTSSTMDRLRTSDEIDRARKEGERGGGRRGRRGKRRTFRTVSLRCRD